jgi:WD40 repeat protein
VATASLEIYDATTGAQIGLVQAYDPEWWWLQEVEFSQDGRFLFTGSNSGTIREKLNKKTGKMEKRDRGEPIKMWDSSTLKLMRTFGDHKDGETFLKSSVRSLSHSARNGLLLAGFDGGRIRAWNVETGEERLSRSGWVSSVIAKFSQDGSRLAVADQGSHSVTIFKILYTR